MIRFQRGLAILLSTCMIGGMMPLPVSAEEAVPENIVQAKSTENTENLENAQSENYKSSETESETTTDTEAEDTAIADVQTLIDALPDADGITEDNVENVTSQLDTIDEAKAELSDADMSQLDLTRYDAAINKVMVLMGMKEENDSEIAVQANDSAGKTEQQSTDEASVTINGETLYYATLEEAFSAADGKTATITMLNDAECTVTSGSPISVMNKSNITLNMNGKTLSGHGTGDCGIITLATGSLSVQGPGTMKSTFKCLSCQSKNAKMTVENITFDVSEADYGVWVVSSNTVTLNNIQIIGKAKTSAVYQYSNSANVTINNMNAIEAGYSDVVYKGGTLKINGGTFDKISVTSNNTGSITSVSQVLGEGCIYRYADKTWETSELSNTLEISNVTVEKIPLTINPETEATSWHNNSAEHRLQMNAKPTTENNEVTYEWYDGDTKLECVSDTYTIPKIMSVGNYTYTCKATCDGYTLSHEFTFTVEEEECKHEDVEISFNSNGFGNCPKCNATVYQPAVETTDKYDIDDDGTKDTVYEISNAGQLYWFAGLVNGTLDGVEQNASANAILTANIAVNENLLGSLQYDTEGNVSNGSDFTSWTPIGSWDKDYTGTFDGNNKTASGLYFNDTSICIGLFGSSEGNIKNVGVVDSYFKGNNFVAGVCGLNIGIIENCYNTGNILTFPEEAANVGGVCGCNSGSITNCYNTGTVTAPGSVPSIVGGVCGSNNGSTTNCYNVGTVTATDSSADVGGVCGVAWGSTTNCYYNSDAYNGDAIGYGSATAYDACKTTAQFASGEVAYLLSQGCTIDEVNYDGTIWGQRLGEDGDTYPVLDSTKRVYQVDKYDGCEGKLGSSTKVYSNQSTSIYEEHKYEADTTDPTKHKCSICNGSEVHSFAYELVENGNAIKATCSECGATYTIKLTQPAATSDEKIVYDGTEKKAGTAIDSGNTGIETIPENAITYAVVTNGTPSTYSTAAPKNAGTYKAKLTLGTGDNIVSIEINFTIAKAAKAPNMPGTAMAPAHSIEKVGNITLPEGWSWQEADKDTALADGVAMTATAVYTGADKGNYETERVSITITRSECDHTHTEIRNQQEATCKNEGYTGDTYCADCGEKLATGTATEKKPHTVGTPATCVSKAVCSVCSETFGEVDATNHVHTTVKNRKEATCTQTGYTGDTYCTDCDKLLSTGKELAALGHNYKATVTKQPTTTEEGVRTYNCTRCNSSYTESIAKLPEERHNHSYTESIPETGHSYTQPIAKIKSDDSSKDNGNQNQKPQSGTDNGDQSQKLQSDTDNGKDNSTSIKPYIKDDSGKEGWDVIKTQLEEAESGDTVTVTMNGSRVVPKDVIESIKDKDTALVLDMGNGLSWKINGKDITDVAGDIDFGVTAGADAGKSIPVDIINSLTGERSSMNLTLAYDGEFGFTATLTVNMEAKNAGLYANLFYYNEQNGQFEFVSAGQIDADGNAELAFTHASDYTIVIDAAVMNDENEEIVTSTESTETSGDETIQASKEDDVKADTWNPIIIIIGICSVLAVLGAVIFVRKKSHSEEK